MAAPSISQVQGARACPTNDRSRRSFPQVPIERERCPRCSSGYQAIVRERSELSAAAGSRQGCGSHMVAIRQAVLNSRSQLLLRLSQRVKARGGFAWRGQLSCGSVIALAKFKAAVTATELLRDPCL
jgi:hypothetical protein